MKALVISGGGSKGAYAVGILQHLLGNLQIRYDAILGVSSGAICAAFLGMFSCGQEQEAIKAMAEMWLTLDNDKIYRRWHPWGRFHVLWKLGFFDSTPMQDLIRNAILLDKIRASGKSITVGAVSLTSGKYTNFNQHSEHFIDAVIGSASFPVMFEPIKIGDQLWVDGGVKGISPISTAIVSGATEIDVIATSPINRDKKWINKPNIIDVLERSFDLFTEKILTNDIEKMEMHNQLALAGIPNNKYVKLNVFRPEHNLIEDLLDFRPDKIREMMQKGLDDAKSKFSM